MTLRNFIVIYAICYTSLAYATNNDKIPTTEELIACKTTHEKTNPNITNNAMLWYRTSDTKKALFNQINSQVLNALNTYNYKESTLNINKAITISLDNTVLDSSDYEYYKQLHCIESNMTPKQFFRNYQLKANPGIGNLTCTLQSQKIKVFIITNRSASDEAENQGIISTTIKNLIDQNVCFDAILFANEDYETNVNPRLNAIKSGDYENIITTKKLAAMDIIAYLGSDITDFPDFKQDSANNLANDDIKFNQFGSNYFIYPNPLSGSWIFNYWQ